MEYSFDREHALDDLGFVGLEVEPTIIEPVEHLDSRLWVSKGSGRIVVIACGQVFVQLAYSVSR